GKWRDVDATPSTWTLGGGSNPAADDGIDYDPNIIDMILEGDGQEQMLASYDVDGHVYATLTGFEMPEIPQQIFGASVETVTSSSAVLTWSTTVSAAT
ncbi:MAG: glucodextranase DOMON-like domain-containing protein, partial [Candidatus Poseidoniaceae archaeon]